MDKDADFAAWAMYAMEQLPDPAGGAAENALQKEVRCWTIALRAAAEVEAGGNPGLRSPDLLLLRKMQQAGVLESGILLLMYREAYRAQLEAWRAANPDGLRNFIETWRLMP